MATLSGINTLGTNGIEILKGAALINSQLERLLFTEIGTVPGYPDWGSRIPDYMYDGMTTDLAADILREVKYLISTYETRITLLTAKVTLRNASQENVGVIIEITYEYPGDLEPVEAKFVNVRKAA